MSSIIDQACCFHWKSNCRAINWALPNVMFGFHWKTYRCITLTETAISYHWCLQQWSKAGCNDIAVSGWVGIYDVGAGRCYRYSYGCNRFCWRGSDFLGHGLCVQLSLLMCSPKLTPDRFQVVGIHQGNSPQCDLGGHMISSIWNSHCTFKWCLFPRQRVLQDGHVSRW